MKVHAVFGCFQKIWKLNISCACEWWTSLQCRCMGIYFSQYLAARACPYFIPYQGHSLLLSFLIVRQFSKKTGLHLHAYEFDQLDESWHRPLKAKWTVILQALEWEHNINLFTPNYSQFTYVLVLNIQPSTANLSKYSALHQICTKS